MYSNIYLKVQIIFTFSEISVFYKCNQFILMLKYMRLFCNTISLPMYTSKIVCLLLSHFPILSTKEIAYFFENLSLLIKFCMLAIAYNHKPENISTNVVVTNKKVFLFSVKETIIFCTFVIRKSWMP